MLVQQKASGLDFPYYIFIFPSPLAQYGCSKPEIIVSDVRRAGMSCHSGHKCKFSHDAPTDDGRAMLESWAQQRELTEAAKASYAAGEANTAPGMNPHTAAGGHQTLAGPSMFALSTTGILGGGVGRGYGGEGGTGMSVGSAGAGAHTELFTSSGIFATSEPQAESRLTPGLGTTEAAPVAEATATAHGVRTARNGGARPSALSSHPSMHATSQTSRGPQPRRYANPTPAAVPTGRSANSAAGGAFQLVPSQEAVSATRKNMPAIVPKRPEAVSNRRVMGARVTQHFSMLDPRESPFR